MMEQLALETKETLAQTIQAVIQLGHVPAQWKTAAATMISKVGRDHKTLKGYRPLSLTSCLGKLCKIILSKHLVKSL